jgi:hypothetical protein
LNKGFLETGADPYFTIGFNEGRDYSFNEDHRLRYDWTDAIFLLPRLLKLDYL